MLTWLDELTDPASWRDAEEAVMGLFAELLAGRVPDLPAGALPLVLRRFGYLVELAALQSEAAVADRLAVAVGAVRERLSVDCGGITEPAALLGRPQRPAFGGDDIARRWGLVSGLDLDRFAEFLASRVPRS